MSEDVKTTALLVSLLFVIYTLGVFTGWVLMLPTGAWEVCAT